MQFQLHFYSGFLSILAQLVQFVSSNSGKLECIQVAGRQVIGMVKKIGK